MDSENEYQDIHSIAVAAQAIAVELKVTNALLAAFGPDIHAIAVSLASLAASFQPPPPPVATGIEIQPGTPVKK
jgi:hypothetical protein